MSRFAQPKQMFHTGVYLNGDVQDVEESHDYFKPGCYFVPQLSPNALYPANELVRTPSPISHALAYSNENVTYVIDNYGTAYYVTDLEFILPPPSQLVYATTAYLIYEQNYDEKAEKMNMDSLKKANLEKFEEEPGVNNDKSVHKDAAQESKADMYRAEEGYLVEEPKEETQE